MEEKENIKDILDGKNTGFAALQDFFGEDFQEEADFIGEKLNISPEIIQRVLDATEAFSEIAQGNPEYIVEDVDEDGLPIMAISGDKLMEYVTDKTGMDIEILDKIYDCEMDYFEQFGLVD